MKKNTTEKERKKPNYKKMAWAEYKKLGRSKEQFLEHWNYKSKIGKSLYSFKNIRYTHYIYESLIQNKYNNAIDEFIGSGEKNIKEFGKNYFKNENGFVNEVLDRFSGYMKTWANPKNPTVIIRENEFDGEIDYDISSELYDKLIDSYGSFENLIGYTIENMFEDFKKGIIPYNLLIENIEILRKSNEEIEQKEYKAGKD